MLERHTEQALKQAVEHRGGLAIKLTSPATTGLPDRLILLPGGHLSFIELKRPGAKPRPLQQHRLHQLQQLGFHATVLDHPNHIKDLLNEIQTT